MQARKNRIVILSARWMEGRPVSNSTDLKAAHPPLELRLPQTPSAPHPRPPSELSNLPLILFPNQQHPPSLASRPAHLDSLDSAAPVPLLLVSRLLDKAPLENRHSVQDSHNP